MTIEQAVIEKLKTLPADKQQEVLDFVESLQAKTRPEGLQAHEPEATLAQQA